MDSKIFLPRWRLSGEGTFRLHPGNNFHVLLAISKRILLIERSNRLRRGAGALNVVKEGKTSKQATVSVNEQV